MSTFRFKGFDVDQDGCAMKINTDGVLIGAIASHSQPLRGLDIGTGTGVIAMMLAQRYPQLHIHAIEIDAQAAETAGRNFLKSSFNNRLTVNHVAIEQYSAAEQFDLIVSNPPFFVNDLKNIEKRKSISRHASRQFFDTLIGKANELLTQKGKLWLILPVKQANEVIEFASLHQLRLAERINLHSDKHKPTFRQIICLAKEDLGFTETDFYIYESPKVHTSSYKTLLKDFFLAY